MSDAPLPAALPDPSTATGRLVARERVRAMESLAGVIAHEIRSAVLGVTSAAQLLRYALPADPVSERSLGRILQESERLSALHEALSEYATEIPPRFAPLNPNHLLRQVVAGMRGPLEANSISITLTESAKHVACPIDAEQMTRALERIVHHAIARSKPGTELSVTSTVDAAGDWHAEFSAVNRQEPLQQIGGEFERPSFLIALANRTFVAHGGDVVDRTTGHGLVRLSIRLPSSRSE